jgi:hypothetical protein
MRYLHIALMSMLLIILTNGSTIAQGKLKTDTVALQAESIDVEIPENLATWQLKLTNDTFEIPIKIKFPEGDEKSVLPITCEVELVQEEANCSNQFLNSIVLQKELVFNAAAPSDTAVKSLKVKNSFKLHLNPNEKCLEELFYLRIQLTYKFDTSETKVIRILKVSKSECLKNKETTKKYDYEFLYKNKRYYSKVIDEVNQKSLQVSSLSNPEKSGAGKTEKIESRIFTTLESEEIFRLAFEEAFKSLHPEDTQGIDSLLIASKASIFFAQIKSQRKVETEKKKDEAYAKGFAKAQNEFDSGPIVPAGILSLITSELDISSAKDGSRILKIDSVVVSINNSVLDQTNVFGKVVVKKNDNYSKILVLRKRRMKHLVKLYQEQGIYVKHEKLIRGLWFKRIKKKKYRFILKTDKAEHNIHFYNNSYSVSLNQIISRSSILSESVQLKYGQSEVIALNLSDILSYKNAGSKPLSQRVRDASFTLKSTNTSKTLERHRITDYIETAIYSDVFGLQENTAGSMLLTDISLNYPINQRNRGRFTLFQSVDVLFNIARIGNEESSIITKTGRSRTDFAPGSTTEYKVVEYVSIFDYLEYYSLMNYVGLNVLSYEIKPLESRVNFYGGLTIFRTNLEIKQDTADPLKAKILTPAMTFGLNFNTSFLDNKMGLVIDARGMFLTPTRQPEFSYTDNARRVSSADNLFVGVNNNNLFWVQVYELKGFYKRENGGKFFARLRYFDTFTSRDAYMQFFVGYSVPVSSIKL